MSLGLVDDPLLQPLPVGQLPRVHGLRIGLRFSRINAEQRWNARDHIPHSQVARHDIGAIKVDRAEIYAPFGFANARFYKPLQ